MEMAGGCGMRGPREPLSPPGIRTPSRPAAPDCARLAIFTRGGGDRDSPPQEVRCASRLASEAFDTRRKSEEAFWRCLVPSPGKTSEGVSLPGGEASMEAAGPPAKQGLYDPALEHDSCGFGFVADIQGRPSHDIVKKALEVLMNLEHRGATGAEKDTGDGAGILLQTPHAFLSRECGKLGLTLPGRGRYGVGMVFL